MTVPDEFVIDDDGPRAGVLRPATPADYNLPEANPLEPIPDLDDDFEPGGCPQCGGLVEYEVVLGFPPTTTATDTGRWHCDHCRITWQRDGTGGQQS